MDYKTLLGDLGKASFFCYAPIQSYAIVISIQIFYLDILLMFLFFYSFSTITYCTNTFIFSIGYPTNAKIIYN